MTTATLTSKGQITIPVEVREALGVESGDRVEFVMLLQFFERIGARRVQQSILWLPMVELRTNQRFFDQTGNCVTDLSIVGALFARDMPRSLKAEMFDKPGNSSENNPLHVRQQIVAPIQRCPERLMPGDRRPMAQFQQFQPRYQASHRAPDA